MDDRQGDRFDEVGEAAMDEAAMPGEPDGGLGGLLEEMGEFGEIDEMTDLVIDSFYGSGEFPIDWKEGEESLFWVLDDLHLPEPVAPLSFDIGGWWLACGHVFRRAALPFASDWIAKSVNGYAYVAGIPPDPSIRVDAARYGTRYVPQVPEDGDAGEWRQAYVRTVGPAFMRSFRWRWTNRLRPEIESNLAYLDGQSLSRANIRDLAILLEDAIEIHERHWRIGWLITLISLQAAVRVNLVFYRAGLEVDPDLIGRLRRPGEGRHWESIAALWQMSDEVAGDPELRHAFASDAAGEVIAGLADSQRGRRFAVERLEPYLLEFGNTTLWPHELCSPTWREDPTPVVAALSRIVESGYGDVKARLGSLREDAEVAQRQLLASLPVTNILHSELEEFLELWDQLRPIAADAHFLVDEGTNARLRLIVVAIGRHFFERSLLDDPEQVFLLHYAELRAAVAKPDGRDWRAIARSRAEARGRAARITPPSWIGTASESTLAFPYLSLWGFPDKRDASPLDQAGGVVQGVAASPGVAEGTARVVRSTDDFTRIESGEIVVARTVGPSWISGLLCAAGLVTNAGGAAAAPAALAHALRIPAVVGASGACERIATGDRLRVDGSSGVVEILR